MSDNARRKLLKSITAGSGVIIAGKNLPDSWSRPIVDSIMLPAHAQTSNQIYSSNNVQISMNGDQSGEDSLLAGLARSLVPEAGAQFEPAIGCCRVVGSMLNIEIFDPNYGPSGGVWSGALPLDMQPAVCTLTGCGGDFSEAIQIISINNNEVVIDTGEPKYTIPAALVCVDVPTPVCV